METPCAVRTGQMAVLEGGGSKGPEQLMAQERIRGWMLAQSSATHVCSGHLGTASTVLLPATAATRRPSLAPPCMLLLARSLGAPPPPIPTPASLLCQRELWAEDEEGVGALWRG